MNCPDCDDPLIFTYRDTSGQGAHKRGDNLNTTPDTDHYVCFWCGKAWQQRLDGPLTPDVVGELAFFNCRATDCGRTLSVEDPTVRPENIRLTCPKGHSYQVTRTDAGELVLHSGLGLGA